MGLDNPTYNHYNTYMQKNFELSDEFVQAIERLQNPAPGVVRGQVDVIRASIREEWKVVFPNVPFPGDEQ